MKEKQKRKNLYTKFEKEQKKKQKRSPSIQPIYLSNESPEPCTSYRIASNRSKRKTQESAKKSIHKIIREMKQLACKKHVSIVNRNILQKRKKWKILTGYNAECDASEHWFQEFCVSRDESSNLLACKDCF